VRKETEGSRGSYGKRGRTADDGRSLGRGIQDLLRRQALYERERTEAHGLVTELLAHPPDRQRLIVQNHARFHTWGVYGRLLDESRAQGAQGLQSTTGAEHWARLGLVVAEQLDTSLYPIEGIEDLRARAWSYIANARRQRSNWAGAEEAFRTAEHHLQEGTGDPIEKGMLLDVQASLLRAQRRFDRAMALLQRAYTIFLTAGDDHRAGRVLVSMEIIHHHSGTPERGIPLLYQALELIDPQQEPRLLLCIWHNLIDGLVETGRTMEARRLFREARSLYPRFPEAVTQNRRAWVAGKIARGLGQDREAEELLLAARQGFLAEDVPYEVALVSLDLAALYARQGRTDELQRLAAEMVHLFSSRQIHREALAALAYWKQAVETGTAHSHQATQATAGVVAGVAAFLKRARYDDELRFTIPSPE
jgi:pentatricopeptide repeat protein